MSDQLDAITKTLSKAQIAALPNWRNATDYFGGFKALLSDLPWASQISEALVRRGLLTRHDQHPGICLITPLGLKVLDAMDTIPDLPASQDGGAT